MDTTTETPQSPQDTPQITLADLGGLQNVLEAACQRGAFRAHEMKAVGELYDRLSAFLKAVQPQVQPLDNPTPEGGE